MNKNQTENLRMNYTRLQNPNHDLSQKIIKTYQIIMNYELWIERIAYEE